MSISKIAAVVMASLPSALADNSTNSTGLNVIVDVQGQSGKFKVYNEEQGADSGIQVIMDALHEVDADGNKVGTSGNVKHSIQTFAPQEFTIADAEIVDLGNVTANKIAFTSPIAGVGMIRVDTFIMAEDGFAGPPGEQWPVRTGDLKWNIELYDWDWCGCKSGQTTQVGAFIDVVVSLKSMAEENTTALELNTDNTSMNLGGGLTMELSKQVQVDGVWQDMPEGYPMVETQGSMTTMTFRFPRFTQSAMYDPIVGGFSGDDSNTDGDNDDDNSNNDGDDNSGNEQSVAHRSLAGISAAMMILLTTVFGV